MAITPVLAVLRRVASSEDAWPEATLQRVSLALAASGLPTSRELRLGFPPQEERRREEVRGLAAELAAKLLVDPAELGVLIDAAVCSTMGIATSPCFGPLARGEIRGSKRLPCGVYVDGVPEPTATTTSTLPAASSSWSYFVHAHICFTSWSYFVRFILCADVGESAFCHGRCH